MRWASVLASTGVVGMVVVGSAAPAHATLNPPQTAQVGDDVCVTLIVISDPTGTIVSGPYCVPWPLQTYEDTYGTRGEITVLLTGSWPV